MKYVAILIAIGFLRVGLSAQQLVRDPYTRDKSQWSTLDALSQVQILRWGPLTFETRVTDQNKAGKRIGVTQKVMVPADDWYQLVVHVATLQDGATGRVPFGGTVGNLVVESGAVHGDTRMVVGRLTKGTHVLTLFTSTVRDHPGSHYRLLFKGVFLYRVALPCPSWTLKSAWDMSDQMIRIEGIFRAEADYAVVLLAKHELLKGIRVPGIEGELVLDPARGWGLMFLPPRVVDNGKVSFTVWPWMYVYWPALSAQILAVDKDVKPVKLTLGSARSTRF